MFAKLDSIEERYAEIEQELSSSDVLQDQQRYAELAKAHADLGEIISVYREYKEVLTGIEENQDVLSDGDQELRELAKEELSALETRQEELHARLQKLLLPKDPMDDKNIILEIRAGTGGEEAALFVADLLRMYTRYAETMHWKVELMNSHPTGSGGMKEVIASISGASVYSRLKYESGVHRVQRVPSTESQGRIHTSAVTVAILPEAEEVDVEIDPSELRIDYFRASGPGGQSVNTTDSAVRITHIPSGVVVSCQDEKSQHKNKAKAMKVLRSRILKAKQEEAKKELDASRRSQVGSGDRSERIRTYNFPQGRITDHRINLTLYSLENVLAGNMDEVIEPLVQHDQAEALRAQAEE
ncbi:peptide chain release factor 1 [Desulfohalobium retbaense]|uniref:Peptide chain release factor 1 n=1 Tax=Desulfohalobium retbaense (strain ATCC 49708 / DSM 5692 / JCM 16813 / HR100) TaxID=485915 RepID=C8X493_DESRD|nr:peptide chain release factor 1 [Desulfohalobium retbaense]ACV69367.1 peptide chain release factor 1 [Desulfohalobium retbaense DSM 5692]